MKKKQEGKLMWAAGLLFPCLLQNLILLSLMHVVSSSSRQYDPMYSNHYSLIWMVPWRVSFIGVLVVCCHSMLLVLDVLLHQNSCFFPLLLQAVCFPTMPQVVAAINKLKGMFFLWCCLASDAALVVPCKNSCLFLLLPHQEQVVL